MRKLAAAACLALVGCAAAPERGVVRQRAYGLIHPLLDVENPVEFRELRPFKHRVQALLSVKEAAGAATHVSVYFRDLHNGPWFGIKEKEAFTPASLLKLPVLIAALRHAEQEPSFLGNRVEFKESMLEGMDSIPQDIGPAETIEDGKSYPVSEILRRMIVHSDNRAKNLTLLLIPGKWIDAVFADLGLTIPDVRGPDDYMSVREYGTFFRILYNASYLGRTMSQRALEYLAACDFKEGLVAGVPPGTVVAHKFGERNRPSKRERQLHDCGIVYHPRRPYLLCVMTRGSELESLKGTIKDVSALVYREVDAQSRQSKERL